MSIVWWNSSRETTPSRSRQRGPQGGYLETGLAAGSRGARGAPPLGPQLGDEHTQAPQQRLGTPTLEAEVARLGELQRG